MRLSPTLGAGGRLVYVDWLRVVAVAGVFAVHISEVFNPYDEWHIANAQRSPLIGEIAVLMAPWNLSWHHLWFLAHLMLYALVTLPLFRYLQTDRGRVQLRRLARLTTGPAGLFWLALPLMLERNLLWGLFRERHYLTADWSNHSLLLVAYIYGFILAGEPWLGLQIDRQWRRALSVAFACTGLLVYLTWTNVLPYGLPAPYAAGYLAFWAFYSLTAWAWMIGLLGAARRFARREDGVLDYGRRIGYGWYLVHQPVIIAVAYFVVPWQASVGLKFVVLTSISLAGTLVGAEAIRRIPMVRTLLGVAPARHHASGATHAPTGLVHAAARRRT